MPSTLKIVFAGTPEIARQVLANILDHNYQVSLVLTQPDRPAGRGLKLTASPVKQLAIEHEIPVIQPVSFKKDPAVLQQIRDLAPDILVVVAYGLILPSELLAIPRLGAVNIHVSILPRWRGAAPIQRAILAGDSESGVTIMQMDHGLDTGDILLSEKIQIDANDTSGSLHDKLALIGADKIVEFLAHPESYMSIRQPQDGVTYAEKISKDEARIVWDQPSDVIARNIRGYNPFPGAFSFLDGVLHKLWKAKLVNNELSKEAPGTIIKAIQKDLWVSCGDGKVLAIEELQEPGTKRKSVVQYLQAKHNLLGKRFEVKE